MRLPLCFKPLHFCVLYSSPMVFLFKYLSDFVCFVQNRVSINAHTWWIIFAIKTCELPCNLRTYEINTEKWLLIIPPLRNATAYTVIVLQVINTHLSSVVVFYLIHTTLIVWEDVFLHVMKSSEVMNTREDGFNRSEDSELYVIRLQNKKKNHKHYIITFLICATKMRKM